MYVYWGTLSLVVAIAVFADFIAKNSKNHSRSSRPLGIAAFLIFLILATISSLRWGVGTDYWNYLRNFPSYAEEASRGIRLSGEEGLALWEEPGIRFISLIVQYLDGTALGMMAVAAFITIFLSVWAIRKHSPTLSFGIAIYILSGSWHGSFNVVRQYIAAAILLAGHRYVLERKFFKWFLVVFLASLFHISAWIGIFFYWVPRKRLSFAHQILIMVAAVLISSASGAILEFLQQFQDYEGLSGETIATRHVNELRVLFALLPVVLFWLLPKPKSLQAENSWFYVNMLLIYAAFMLSMSTSVFLSRFVIYPHIFLAICLPVVTNYDDKNTRLLVRLLYLILFSIFMYVEVSSSSTLRDFQWIFERG